MYVNVPVTTVTEVAVFRFLLYHWWLNWYMYWRLSASLSWLPETESPPIQIGGCRQGRIQRLMQGCVCVCGGGGGGYSRGHSFLPRPSGGVQFTKYIYFSGTGGGGYRHTHPPPTPRGYGPGRKKAKLGVGRSRYYIIYYRYTREVGEVENWLMCL